MYGFGYSAAYEGRYSLRLLGAMLNVLLLSLSVQVMADNALTFLMAWEAMSLSAYAMVLTEHDRPGTVRAAHWYIALTHAGFVALLAMFLLLSGGDLSTSFAGCDRRPLTPGDPRRGVRAGPPRLRRQGGHRPLHVWLPMAHPVAPSHVSALMSGVVIKMGVYGLLRVAIDLLAAGPPWWGGLVLGAGTVSALLGVLYALMEHDLKRLLAYHSVENIGIIFIGIGAGLMFQSFGLPTLATLGIVAGLYHTINHACFKGAALPRRRLGAARDGHAQHGGDGRADQADAPHRVLLPPRRVRDLGAAPAQRLRLRMAGVPGAARRVGDPPARGRDGHADRGGHARADQRPRRRVLRQGVRHHLPRHPALSRAEQAHEAPWSMQAGMATLAVACVVLGLLPFAVVPLLGSSLAGLRGVAPVAMEFTLALPLQVPGTSGQMSPLLLALGLGLLLALVPFALRLLGADRRLRVGDTWGCGRIGQTSRMEYTATAFAEPLRRVFAELYRPTRDLSIDFHPGLEVLRAVDRVPERDPPLDRAGPLRPAAAGGSTTPRYRVRRLQGGSLHLYLFYLTLAFLILLTAARWWR